MNKKKGGFTIKKLLYFSTIITLIVFAISFPTTHSFAMNTYDVIYEGIDVSNWQGHINYSEVKNSGIEIVYIKSSQGTNITDAYFKTNYDNAKANGLKIGFYHYVMARSNEEAIKEAEYFATVISDTSPDCKLAMDFENFGNLNKEEINSISKTFLEKTKELTGKDMIIYSDAYNAKHTFSKELANEYPLWIAEYGVNRPTENINWNSWTGFQYTNSGRINGIPARVDRDKFTNGIFLSNTDSIPSSNNNTNEIEYYTVKRGNTLSEIARWYGTTVNEIAGLNRIRNVNLIITRRSIKNRYNKNI